MADVEPFRAVRYTGAAGPLADLVAPPYDAVTSGERDRLLSRSPYNVVRLTLPDAAEDAGRLYRDWLERGILALDDEPSAWLLVERFAGADGAERERRGVVVSLRAEPYEAGGVLAHERTRVPVREERVDLLRATGAQPEPIFLLEDAPLPLEEPEHEPDLAADGSRLWRLDERDAALSSVRGPLLIADGHHRYESALELARDAGDVRIMGLVVSARDPGLEVLPTHRVFSGRPDLVEAGGGERFETVVEGLGALEALPPERAGALAYRRGGAELVEGPEGSLDVALVETYGPDGIAYTPDTEAAVAAVDRGEADVAFLLRAPRVEDVFAAARRGELMPPKSTYFFPKPLSGLLFHPVRP